MKKTSLFLITIASISMFVFSTQAMKRGSSKLSAPLSALKRRVEEIGWNYVKNLQSLESVYGRDTLNALLNQAEETGDTKFIEGLNLLGLLKNQKLPRGNGPVSRRGGNPQRRLKFGKGKLEKTKTTSK